MPSGSFPMIRRSFSARMDQRIVPDDQAVLLRENGVGFEPGALWGVEFITGAPVSFLIKMQQCVVQRDPDFPIGRIDAYSCKNAPERRLTAAALLAHDLLARGL